MNFQVFKTLKTEKFNENFCLPACRQAGRQAGRQAEKLKIIRSDCSLSMIGNIGYNGKNIKHEHHAHQIYPQTPYLDRH